MGQGIKSETPLNALKQGTATAVGMGAGYATGVGNLARQGESATILGLTAEDYGVITGGVLSETATVALGATTSVVSVGMAIKGVRDYRDASSKQSIFNEGSDRLQDSAFPAGVTQRGNELVDLIAGEGFFELTVEERESVMEATIQSVCQYGAKQKKKQKIKKGIGAASDLALGAGSAISASGVGAPVGAAVSGAGAVGKGGLYSWRIGRAAYKKFNGTKGVARRQNAKLLYAVAFRQIERGGEAGNSSGIRLLNELGFLKTQNGEGKGMTWETFQQEPTKAMQKLFKLLKSY